MSLSRFLCFDDLKSILEDAASDLFHVSKSGLEASILVQETSTNNLNSLDKIFHSSPDLKVLN